MTAKFTNSGEYLVTDMLVVGATVTGWFIGWGSGTTTDVKADLDLEAAATETRVTATAIQEGVIGTVSDQAEWIGTLTKTAVPTTISEAGLFWDATGTTSKMLIRGTHTGVALATQDQIRYTFRLEQT